MSVAYKVFTVNTFGGITLLGCTTTWSSVTKSKVFGEGKHCNFDYRIFEDIMMEDGNTTSLLFISPSFMKRKVKMYSNRCLYVMKMCYFRQR